MHLCWAFSFLEQFPRIQDTFRIPSFFQGLHQFQGHGVCVFGEEGFAGLADAVFTGDGAAHFVDSRAGQVFESCDFCLFISFVGKAPARTSRWILPSPAWLTPRKTTPVCAPIALSDCRRSSSLSGGTTKSSMAATGQSAADASVKALRAFQTLSASAMKTSTAPGSARFHRQRRSRRRASLPAGCRAG